MVRSTLRSGAVAVACVMVSVSAHAQPEQELGPARKAPDNTGPLFDLNVGVPKLELGEVSVIGDGSLGYQWERFGFVGYGSFNAYGYASKTAVAHSRRTSGTVDLWRTFGDAETQWELRPTFGYARYVSRRASIDGDITAFVERSLMARFNAVIGVRHEPKSGRLGVGGWVGVGGQLEGYASVYGNLSKLSGGAAFEGTSTGNVSWRLRGFFYVGDVALARVESDWLYFKITKDSATLNLDSALTGTTNRTTASQIDSCNRLYVDILAASFLGFVPVVTGGVDVFRATADGLPTANSVVPSGGLGIRHSAF